MKEVPTLRQFPSAGFDNSQVDMLNIRKVYFHGLYERTVQLADGTLRTYKAYIPSTAAYGDDSCYVAVPDGVDTAEFLADSGWLDAAERPENSFILFALEPAGQCWGTAEAEMDYISQAFADISNKMGGGFRNLVFISDFNWRWAGYGRGGEMLTRFALQNPMFFASLAVVCDLCAIDNETLADAAKTCFVNTKGHIYEEWPNSRIPVPIWLMGCENTSLVDYWKTANDCLEDCLELKDGFLYRQNPLSTNLMTFDQKIGQVRLSPGEDNFVDTTLTDRIVRFIQSFSRCGMNSPYGNMLYPTTPDSAFQRDTMLSDGREREWYVKVPSSYDGKTPVPMVIYFHGHGQTGLIAMRQGGWWQYGEEKGFITVCPTGSLPERTDNQLPLCAWRNGNFGKLGQPGVIPENRRWIEEADSEIDNRFVRAMLEKLFTQYNIDKTRIYITGQSNGCVMTQMMSEKGSDLFAAAASTGMAVQIALTQLPNFIVSGEYDICPVTLTDNSHMNPSVAEDRFREALTLRGVDYESGGRFRNGIFDNMEWQDERGVPVMRFCCVLGQAHSWRQNMCRVFWDEWFCRFSRDPDTGKILYTGK